MLECLASRGIRYEEHGGSDRKAQFLKQSHVTFLHPQKSYNVPVDPVELELRPVSRSKAKQKAYERHFEAYRNTVHHAVPQLLGLEIAELEPTPAVQALKRYVGLISLPPFNSMRVIMDRMEAFLHAMAEFNRYRGNCQIVGCSRDI